jgi:hypothetical protein
MKRAEKTTINLDAILFGKHSIWPGRLFFVSLLEGKQNQQG